MRAVTTPATGSIQVGKPSSCNSIVPRIQPSFNPLFAKLCLARDRLCQVVLDVLASPGTFERMPKRRDAKTREICERIQKVFGERLKALRAQREMGQKALAPRMQLSRTSVSNLECGLHLPSLDEVYRAAHCFGVPVDALLPPVEEVFPDGAIHTAADDPLTEAAATVAAQIVRDLSGGAASMTRKHTSSRVSGHRPRATASRRTQSPKP